MPIHDWTRVDAGIFHAFHHDWITEIARALNNGVLPAAFYALPEQIAGGFGPDVLTLCRPSLNPSPAAPAFEDGVALLDAPPKVRFHLQSEAGRYAAKAKSVTIRHVSNHQVVALVEIVSPGNKNNQNGLDSFGRKARDALAAGIHLLIVDLFPPGPRGPQGIHPVIWGPTNDEFSPVPDKPLTCAAYLGAPSFEAFIEPIAVGDELPNMPLFLSTEKYVLVPLDRTYSQAVAGMAAYWRDVIDQK